MDNKRIGLGTVQFGLKYGITNTTGQTHSVEVKKILTTATELGIELLDTAGAYGDAESILGKLHSNRFQIVSKFICNGSEKELKNQLINSLNKLNVNAFYGYLAHRPLELLENKDLWTLMNNLKDAGLVKKIGYSLNHPSDFLILKKKKIIPDLIQVPYNYFDTRFSSIIEETKELGGEVHSRSTFLQGLFFAKTKSLPTHFNPVKTKITSLQNEYGDSLQAALLAYVLEFQLIDRVIIGVNDNNQLLHNINSLTSAPKLKPHDMKISELILMPNKWIIN